MKTATATSAISIAMVLLLYVLSIGPVAAWHERNGKMPPHPAVMGFYLPVFWCCEHVRPIRAVMGEYINFWIVLAGTKP